MKRINYYLPEKQIQKIKNYAKETGLSSAEIIRRAVDCYFEEILKKRHKWQEAE